MKQREQAEGRYNQYSRVKSKRADFDPEIVFLCAKEHVRPIATAIIVLLHLGVRNQIRDLLVDIDLFGCDRAVGAFEKVAVEWPFAIENLIYQAEIPVQFADRLRLQS